MKRKYCWRVQFFHVIFNFQNPHKTQVPGHNRPRPFRLSLFILLFQRSHLHFVESVRNKSRCLPTGNSAIIRFSKFGQKPIWLTRTTVSHFSLLMVHKGNMSLEECIPRRNPRLHTKSCVWLSMKSRYPIIETHFTSVCAQNKSSWH